MGFLFIALSVANSLAIAHFLKLAKTRLLGLIQVLIINYLTASIISFSISGREIVNLEVISPSILFFSIILGSVFIANLFVYSTSLEKIGMGISIAAMRMSLVIPIGISLFVYNETVGSIKYLGIILVFVALFLMIPKINSSKKIDAKATIFPIALFIMTGIADASLKIFEREFSSNLPEYGFLGLIFSSSFIIGSIYLLIKKEFRFTRKEVFYGIIVGIANLYSSFFLLLALQEMRGALVFSLTNVSNVVLGAIIGFIVWKDELSLKQKVGIILAAFSITLLI
ncbi:MAG: DMT family transporter [Balneolaceae bacterium]